LDLNFVLGRFTADKPIIRTIVSSLGFLTVDENGGLKAFKDFSRQVQALAEDERRIAIYPEGQISPILDTRGYRAGVYHLYKSFGCNVVPVATNMGLCWPFNHWRKYGGEVTVEFMTPIKPGLSKAAFMERLEADIEWQSDHLVRQAKHTSKRDLTALLG